MNQISAMAVFVELTDPVLIAPAGNHYYRPATIAATLEVVRLSDPVCGSGSDRWIPTDTPFAVALGRIPCSKCWPDGPPNRKETEMTDEHLTLAKVIEVADPRGVNKPVTLFGVAVLEGYGRRIVDVEPGPGGSTVMTGSRNCVHGRPLRGNLVSPAEWVAICRACEFELDRVDATDRLATVTKIGE